VENTLARTLTDDHHLIELGLGGQLGDTNWTCENEVEREERVMMSFP
jgi:hypothetical protein